MIGHGRPTTGTGGVTLSVSGVSVRKLGVGADMKVVAVGVAKRRQIVALGSEAASAVSPPNQGELHACHDHWSPRLDRRCSRCPCSFDEDGARLFRRGPNLRRSGSVARRSGSRLTRSSDSSMPDPSATCNSTPVDSMRAAHFEGVRWARGRAVSGLGTRRHGIDDKRVRDSGTGSAFNSCLTAGGVAVG